MGETKAEANCPEHGAFRVRTLQVLGRPIRSQCPKCLEEERKRQAAEDAARRLQEVESRIIPQSGIPKRFVDRTLTNYRVSDEGQRRALAAAAGLAETETEGASAIFCGRPGTGKTHLACGVARAFIASGRTARFATVLAALRRIKDTYRRGSDVSEEQVMREFLRPDLLVLDEVGIQVGSEHEKMLLFEIINERYQNCRSTILISNLTREEIGEYLGQRVMDRFAEGGAVVAFDWDSYRTRKDAAR